MKIEEEYQQTLDYLYSFVDYSLQKSFRYSPEKFDLARMRVFMDALGNPERAYPVIHIAGTKGKGSVASFCASALLEGGYRVGLYTSPHLQDYIERIQVDGRPMSHGDLVDLVKELKPRIESIPEVTTFEITTALAFLYFQRQRVNAAVVEVGLGGRLDATNVCQPAITVITSLSYDHTYLLGDTLAEIAAEKGGIIKHGVPVVLSPQKDEARLVIEKIAAERDAPLVQVGRNYLFEPGSHSLEGQSLRVWKSQGVEALVPNPSEVSKGIGTKVGQSVHLDIPLLGVHQVENAATAYATLDVAQSYGLPLNGTSVRRGFGKASWPGRFEILRRHPPVIIDSAHNRDSVLKLRLALDDYFPGIPVVLIFGASEDKDIRGMFEELLPRVSQVVVTKSFHPRAMEPEALSEIAAGSGLPVKAVSTIEGALEEAEFLAAGEALILITGSIFLAAAARSAWDEFYKETQVAPLEKRQINHQRH
jgi:dihydrofolate synthase / folylpolyglutamate synthase